VSAGAGATVVRRLLAGTRDDGRAMSLAEHNSVHGPLPRPGRHDAKHLRASVAGAGLRGRGGAGFPTVRKLEAAWAAGKRGLLIANGAEGEPASMKDRSLLALTPHLVLDGAQLAARTMAAREVLLAVHDTGRLPAALVRAVDERRSSDAIPVRLLPVPHRYLSGEASALARAAGGGPSLPVLHDQPLAERGLNGRPTVVLNAETLAGLALYVRHGAAWYGEIGTADEPGSVLVTVRSHGTAPRLLELALGTPLRVVLDEVCVAGEDPQAVLVGGYFGAWLAVPAALDVPLSHAALRAAGGTLGAGVVIALGQDECGLRATAEVVRYLAGESAKQCGPCLNGLPALATAFDALAAGWPAAGTLDRVRQLCGILTGRGLCHHPDGSAALVRSALAVFADDVTAHQRGSCDRPAGRALAVPAVRA
jgi:NADH:ubiquinone oxidoreductase subunit F (NADH-binding)